MSSSTLPLALPFYPAVAEDRPHLEIFEERSLPGDLSQCDELDLVKKVKEEDNRAFEELARRLEPQRRALIDKVLRRWRLGEADFPDAEQVALWATFLAALQFDPERAARSGCAFASFALTLIGRKVSNFARTEWRYKRPYEHSKQGDDALEAGSRHTRPSADPVQEAARREFGARLQKFLKRKKRQAFWELLVAKVKLPDIARQLGITQRQAERWKEELRKALRKDLKPFWD